MISTTSSSFASAHRDVLEADIPSDPTALVAELKRRAMAAVGASQWPDAAALYEKATACCRAAPSLLSPDQLAIYSANLSLCLGKMNRWTEAADSAEAAVTADASYVKGWWRRSQAQAALNNYDVAVSSLEHALTLDGSNKALLKELAKLKEQQQRYQEEQAQLALQQPEIATTSEPKVTISSSTTKPSNGSSKDTSTTTLVDDETASDFTKSDHIKGYKIVQGKKTSYFHHELSEDAARLIGDIAPQKIDPNTVPTTNATNDAGTSVWNTAGTWEEKDYSAWAQSTMTELLMQATYTFVPSSPAPGAQLTVTQAVVQGHASVATVRGKKRYLYEMDVTVHWTFGHERDDSPVNATGTIRFPDIDGTLEAGDQYDVTDFVVTDTNDATVTPLVTQYCQYDGLRVSLQEKLDAWVNLFRQTY